MKQLTIISFMLFSLFSCANAKNPPVKGMKSYSYYYHTSPAYNSNEYSAKLLDNGKCQISFTHNRGGDTIIVDGEVMKQIEAVYVEHKIHKYKERYLPSFEVLDGDSWGYNANFEEASYSSHGSNAGPSDRGLDEINDIIMNLLRANYIEQYGGCVWKGKIKDNDLTVSFAEKDSVVSVSIQLSNANGTWLSVAGDLEAYKDALASFHGKLKDQLSDSTQPVVTCVDVYVKPGGNEISLCLTGNDMSPLIEEGIEGSTWEDRNNIILTKMQK